MLKFKIKSRTSTVGSLKGQALYYASQESSPRVSLSVIAERVQSATALNKADVRSCIMALTEVLEQELQQGRTVELGELGTLRIVAGAKLMDKPEQVTARTINAPRVRFNPSRQLKAAALRVPLSVERADGTTETDLGGSAGTASAEGSTGGSGTSRPGGGF